MSAAIDLTEQRFTKLVAKDRVGSNKRGQALWHCVCDCGNEVNLAAGWLRSGNTKSCGCLKIESIRQRFTKHGHSKNQASQTATYNSWQAMKQRCLDPNAARFP